MNSEDVHEGYGQVPNMAQGAEAEEKQSHSWDGAAKDGGSHQARRAGLEEQGCETAPWLSCGSVITQLQGKSNMHMNDRAGRGTSFLFSRKNYGCL